MTRSANFFRSHSQARCFAPQGLDTADLASGRHLEHRARRSSAGAILDHPTPRAIRPRSASLGLLPSSWGGAGQNQGMKRTLLLALALAVIPVTVDAQVTELAQLRALAEQGNAVAQYNLGFRYANGDGVPQDNAEAERWYRLAAYQGHADAQYSLGLMYQLGYGVPEEDAEAERWYRLAADQGHADAQYSLGTLYAGGEGVPEDHVLAYMWFNLAAAQGNEDAESGKAGIEEQMTRAQIAEGQRMSREWIEAHPGGN